MILEGCPQISFRCTPGGSRTHSRAGERPSLGSRVATEQRRRLRPHVGVLRRRLGLPRTTSRSSSPATPPRRSWSSTPGRTTRSRRKACGAHMGASPVAMRRWAGPTPTPGAYTKYRVASTRAAAALRPAVGSAEAVVARGSSPLIGERLRGVGPTDRVSYLIGYPGGPGRRHGSQQKGRVRHGHE